MNLLTTIKATQDVVKSKRGACNVETYYVGKTTKKVNLYFKDILSRRDVLDNIKSFRGGSLDGFKTYTTVHGFYVISFKGADKAIAVETAIAFAS